MGVLEHEDYAGKARALAITGRPARASGCLRRRLLTPRSSSPPQLLYLYSSQSSSQLVIVAQRKLETQLESYSVPFVKIDGMGAPGPRLTQALAALVTGACASALPDRT